MIDGQCWFLFWVGKKTPEFFMCLREVFSKDLDLLWGVPRFRKKTNGHFRYKGMSPQNMAKKMVLTYLHFRILKFPLAKTLGCEDIEEIHRLHPRGLDDLDDVASGIREALEAEHQWLLAIIEEAWYGLVAHRLRQQKPWTTWELDQIFWGGWWEM